MKSMKYSNKWSLLKSKNSLAKVEKIYLDKPNSWYGNEFPKLKDLVIKENRLSKNYTIIISESGAENIYFDNYDNLEGLTVPYDVLKKYENGIEIQNKNILSKLKKVNIIIDNNVLSIDIKEPLKELVVSLIDHPEYYYEAKLNIFLTTQCEEIRYCIDKNNEIKETKLKYIITNKDIKDGVLDLRGLSCYKELEVDSLNIDTLVIDKEYLKNIDKLKFLKWNRQDKNKIMIEKLRIIDEDDMRLMPFDKTFLCYENRNLVSNGKYNYICLKTEEDEILIYLDDKEHIQVIKKSELLNDNDIDDVLFRFIDTVNSYNDGRKLNLILVKYKNGTYKVINFDEVYEITELFTNYVSLMGCYVNYNDGARLKRFNDWENVFNANYFDTYKFSKMINDYKEYKKYLEKLKSIGLTMDAIMYLFSRNINSIVLNDTSFEIEDLSKKEIEEFNELGEYYVKSKKLK